MLRIGLICACVSLSSCSSSSGDGGLARGERAAAMDEALDGENISKPEALPQKGTASYTGFATLALPIGGVTSDYVSDLELTVDFDAPATSCLALHPISRG